MPGSSGTGSPAPGSAARPRPVIGITPDVCDGRYQVGIGYIDMVIEAGGTPVVLPCCASRLHAYLDLCNGFVLTGGDDPDMTQWGVKMHPEAKAIDPQRQAFETALLEALDDARATPVLGVCLGMQLMALHAGGTLDQFLPDTLPTAAQHWGKREHRIEGCLGAGTVHSHHRQAIVEPGGLEVAAAAEDGVIEAVRDPGRPFYVGVQWHPERTDLPALGAGLFEQLVRTARQG